MEDGRGRREGGRKEGGRRAEVVYLAAHMKPKPQPR